MSGTNLKIHKMTLRKYGMKHIADYVRYKNSSFVIWFWLMLLMTVPSLSGCTSLSKDAHYSDDETQNVKILTHDFRLEDQGVVRFFQLDKSLVRKTVSTDPATLIFVVPGSGCQSMQSMLPEYFMGLEGETDALRIFILEKRHSVDSHAKCSDAFIREDYLSRWQADYTQFIRFQLNQAKRQAVKIRRVVVLGISEGAELAALLALQLPEITHLVMLSNGGMQAFDAFRLLAQKQIMTQKNHDLEQQIHHIEAALQNLNDKKNQEDIADEIRSKVINGRSLRYWQELKNLDHSGNLLALTIPIAICMGSADQLLPVESAIWLQERFQAAHKNNLSVFIYPQADHGLRAQGHRYLPDCLHQVDLWLGISLVNQGKN